MLRHMRQSSAGAAKAASLYLLASLAAAFSILVSVAVLGDVALGSIWVTGAMFGGLLVDLVCAVALLLPRAMSRAPTETGVVEGVEGERILLDLVPFTFIVTGPVLRARTGAAELFTRKEGPVNAA